MDGIKKLGKILYRAYVGVGIAAIGAIALLVIFTVIARYFFSLSWKQLDEFVTTLFAFTTFWGMGIAVLDDEHVVIEIVYRSFKPAVQRLMRIVNLFIMLAVNITVGVYSVRYVRMVGDHLSPGMEVPMKFLYGIMPVCFILCAVCIVVKVICLVKPGAIQPQPEGES